MNILITSIGRRAYLVEYFKKALSNNDKIFVANSHPTYAFNLADGYFISPYIYEEQYIPTIISYCKKYKISAIISVFDIDLFVLANHKELFLQNGIKLIISDSDCIHICNDKLKSFEFLNSNNIHSPYTFCDLAQSQFLLDNNIIQFPLILKPRYGMGSIATYEANNMEELYFFYHYIEKIIQKTYIQYATINNITPLVIIQQKILGIEYGLDIFNSLEKDFINVCAKQKLEMRAGETDSVITCSNTIFLELAKKISHYLKHIGNLDVDCILTNQKQIYVIDINARFGGQYPFSHIAGVNLPLQIIKWLQGNSTDYNLFSYKENMTITKTIFPTEFKNTAMLTLE